MMRLVRYSLNLYCLSAGVLADMDRGGPGPNPLADLDRGVQIRCDTGLGNDFYSRGMVSNF